MTMMTFVAILNRKKMKNITKKTLLYPIVYYDDYSLSDKHSFSADSWHLQDLIAGDT